MTHFVIPAHFTSGTHKIAAVFEWRNEWPMFPHSMDWIDTSHTMHMHTCVAVAQEPFHKQGKGGKATSGNTRQQTQKLTIRHSIVFHLLCDFFHGLFQLSGKGVLAAAVLGFASLALFLFVFS